MFGRNTSYWLTPFPLTRPVGRETGKARDWQLFPDRMPARRPDPTEPASVTLKATSTESLKGAFDDAMTHPSLGVGEIRVKLGAASMEAERKTDTTPKSIRDEGIGLRTGWLLIRKDFIEDSVKVIAYGGGDLQ